MSIDLLTRLSERQLVQVALRLGAAETGGPLSAAELQAARCSIGIDLPVPEVVEAIQMQPF